ncbi:MAG: hypothetical protein DCC48_18410 [Acidobacteria bacterium]|nr:MAG: hypothetical protein DCC48_18410 [Acidobacteriota bacterium]
MLAVVFLLCGAYHVVQLRRAVWRLRREKPDLWERLGRPRHYIVFGYFPRVFINYLHGRKYRELEPGPVRAALTRTFWSLVTSTVLLLILAVGQLVLN